MRTGFRPPPTSELVPLGTRVQWLALLRVTLAGLVILARLALPDIVAGDLDPILLATMLYLAAETATELLRNRLDRDRVLLTTMLLVDGAYLAVVIDLTGGSSSILRSLITLHLIAVTLLVSYRTGLKMAAWHLILLFAVHQVRAGDAADAQRTLAFGIAVLLIGGGAAAFSAVNERELRRRRSDVEALHGFAVSLDHARHAGDVAGVLADHSVSMAGLQSCLVLSHRAGADSILAARGDVAAAVGMEADEDLGPGSVVADAWSRRSTVLVKALDPARDPFLHAALGGAPRVAVVPLFTEGRPAGALVGTFEHQRDDRVPRRVVTTLEQLVAHASLALRNAWLLHDVEELAVTDELTRLANRRQLEAALATDLTTARARGTSVGLILVDLDRFKALNDAHGHLTGDEVLRRVSNVLVGVTELGDTVARYGGEEFALVLPGRDPRATAVAAERARLAIEALQGPVPVTASFGACSFPTDATDGPSLLRAADEAMYESKRAGRNRVTSAVGRTTGWLDLPWRALDWETDHTPAPAPSA